LYKFFQYLNQQSNEDKQAFIIHFPAKSGKTEFAIKVTSQRPDIYYLDLQKTFLIKPDVPSIVDCSSEFLKKYLLTLELKQSVIFIDNPDFLFNTWSPSEKNDLLNWIRVQLRSPGVINKTLIFMIQTDEVLANAQFKNSIGQPRILALNQFESI